MKKINNFILIIFILMLSNISVFADSGFEAIIDMPIGASFTIPIGKPYIDVYGNGSIKSGDIIGKINASAGAAVKLGYLFNIYDDMGISALAEIGYHYNSYTSTTRIEGNGFDLSDTLTKNVRTHSIKIGLLPKFNKGNFSFGLGFGVKIPLLAIFSTEDVYLSETAGEYNRKQKIENFGFEDIKNSKVIPVIPYIKLTADYSFFFVDNIAFNVGVHINYDFGLQQKDSNFREDAIEFGFQLGLRFAPMLE
ncbi:hypothetical protein [Brachyspira intermedia]|uniref:hypothetical protein n=1 Tax=Brachyspira intermedia TaxID=84377 RepID=UPI0030056B58